MKRKRRKEVTVLNAQVIRAVNAIPVTVASQRDSMIHVLHILYKLAYKKNALPGAYIYVPRNFWKKAVGEHYERALNPLRDSGVVQSNDSYSNFPDRAYCKSYRINPNLIDDDVECISYTISVKEGDKQPKDNSAVARYTRRILRSVTLNIRAVKKDVRSYVERGKFIDKLMIDGEIHGKRGIVVDCTGMPYWEEDSITTTIQVAKEMANRNGRSLIKDKNRYTIDSVESYCIKKANQIIRAYEYSIAKFQHRDIYAKRNTKNYRLDSNITSFPTILLSHINIAGIPFVSIDLSNSQFIILANLIERGHFNPDYSVNLSQILHTLSRQGFISIESDAQYYTLTQLPHWYIQHYTAHPAVTQMWAKPMGELSSTIEENNIDSRNFVKFPDDLHLFLELAKSGKIYDFIQEKLGLPSRANAKILAFEIFFAKYKYHGEAKRELKKIFPTLIKIIDDYKKANGSNQFAILLQKRESVIFIDGILPRLIAKGYKVLSKHDSILCLESDLKEVETEMRVVLDKELGRYELKITQANGTPIHAIPKNDQVNCSVNM